MAQTVLITLNIAGSDTGPFDLYCDVPVPPYGFVAGPGIGSPFEVNVPKASLVAGYLSTSVPNGATIIRVKSKGLCASSYVDLPIVGTIYTTTTTTTLFPPTTSTTTTAAAISTTTSTTSSTSTTQAPCRCYLLQNTEAPPMPSTDYGTGAYVDCNGESLLWVIPAPLGQIYICTKDPSSIIVTSGNVSVTLIPPSSPLYVNCSC